MVHLVLLRAPLSMASNNEKNELNGDVDNNCAKVS